MCLLLLNCSCFCPSSSPWPFPTENSVRELFVTSAATLSMILPSPLPLLPLPSRSPLAHPTSVSISQTLPLTSALSLALQFRAATLLVMALNKAALQRPIGQAPASAPSLRQSLLETPTCPPLSASPLSTSLCMLPSHPQSILSHLLC